MFSARPDQARKMDFAIGVITVALAVAAVQRRPDAGDLIGRLDHFRLHKVTDQAVALGIDIGRDVMRDRAGIMTEAHAVIEGDEPSQTGRPSSPLSSASQKRT